VWLVLTLLVGNDTVSQLKSANERGGRKEPKHDRQGDENNMMNQQKIVRLRRWRDEVVVVAKGRDSLETSLQKPEG
jgi:hypothetical protein